VQTGLTGKGGADNRSSDGIDHATLIRNGKQRFKRFGETGALSKSVLPDARFRLRPDDKPQRRRGLSGKSSNYSRTKQM
jgi:hypothetical protein